MEKHCSWRFCKSIRISKVMTNNLLGVVVVAEVLFEVDVVMVVVDIVEVELVTTVVLSVASFDVFNEMVEELIALELDEVEVVDTVAISEIVMFR